MPFSVILVPGKIQLFEFGQPAEMLQSFVGDHGVPQHQPPQILQSRQPFQSLVGERVVTQIQAAEFGQRRQAEIGRAGTGTAKILQFGQRRAGADSGVPDVDLRVEVPADSTASRGSSESRAP